MKIYNPTGFSSSLTGSFSGSLTGTLVTTGHLVPSENEVYDLGSETKRFRDIYLSGSTIYLGAKTLSEDNLVNTDSLQSALPGGTISGSAQIASDISGSFTSVSQSFASERLKNTTDTLTGDLTVTGRITAQEFHTEFVSASIIFKSGSTQFGDSYDDTHIFTGSLKITSGVTPTTGSLIYQAGSLTISGDDADFNLNITTGSSVANLTEFRFRVDNDTMGRMYMHKTSRNMWIGPEATGTPSLYLRDGTGIAMTITGSSVGIGTTAPDTKLHVAHTVNSARPIKVGTSGDSYVAIDFYTDTISSGNLYLIGYGSANAQDGAFAIKNNASHTTTNGTAGDIWFATGGSSTERLRIKGSTGLVGIGTDSPESRLHIIQDSSNSQLTLERTGTSTGKFQIFTNTNSLFIYDAAQTQHRLFINSDGNVGIGTTAPGAKLEVKDSSNDIQMRVGSLTNGRNPYIRLQGQPTSGANNVYADIQLDAENQLLKFNDPGTSSGVIGTNPTVINNVGDVGINTTSPGYRLHVYEPITNVTAQFQSGDNQAWISVRDDGFTTYGAMLGCDHDAGLEVILANNSANKRLVINTDGTVGIGTDSPVSYGLLDVRGNLIAGEEPLYRALDSNKTGVIISGTGGRNGLPQDGSERLPTLRFHDNTPNYGSATATVGEIRGGVEWFSEETSGDYPKLHSAIYTVNEGAYGTAHGLAFYTGDVTERMRILNNGDVVVGKQTFDVDLNGFSIQAASDFAVYSSMGSPYNTYHVYNTLDNRYDFYVSYDGDVYARNTTIQSLSDERLKENIQDLTGSLDVVTSLRPRVFDFKDGSKINSKGFVAQEVEQVLPECVKEFTAGEPLEDGTRYKTVGQDFMPYIVGAIQELKAENDSLKARIEALESQ